MSFTWDNTYDAIAELFSKTKMEELLYIRQYYYILLNIATSLENDVSTERYSFQ